MPALWDQFEQGVTAEQARSDAEALEQAERLRQKQESRTRRAELVELLAATATAADAKPGLTKSPIYELVRRGRLARVLFDGRISLEAGEGWILVTHREDFPISVNGREPGRAGMFLLDTGELVHHGVGGYGDLKGKVIMEPLGGMLADKDYTRDEYLVDLGEHQDEVVTALSRFAFVNELTVVRPEP